MLYYRNENGEHKTIGRYDTEIEAARAYDEKVSSLSKSVYLLNFPSPDDVVPVVLSTSQYIGTYQCPNGRWRAKYRIKGKNTCVKGSFKSEREAALKRDEAVRSLSDHSTYKFNFSDDTKDK